MQKIKLTQGKFALVDDRDFKWLNPWKWTYLNKGYAFRRPGPRTKRVTFLMHRLIIDAPKGVEVDHINGNRLDNRRRNLRLASKSENQVNRIDRRHSSKFKGVYWHSASKKWAAQIRKNNKGIHLGLFKTERAAAATYDIFAKKLHGEFAKLNFKRQLP